MDFHNHAGMMTVGERIRWVRGKRDMSRTALAKASGVPYPTLAGIENGDQDSSTRLHAIAEALSCHVDFLETGRGEWDATATVDDTNIAARIDDIRVAQALLAKAVARSIPDAGRLLAASLAPDALPLKLRERQYLKDLRVIVDAATAPLALPAPTRPAQGSTRRKHP